MNELHEFQMPSPILLPEEVEEVKRIDGELIEESKEGLNRYSYRHN